MNWFKVWRLLLQIGLILLVWLGVAVLWAEHVSVH